MHFLGCLGFVLFSAFAPLLIVLLVEEGWVRGLLIVSTWPIIWNFTETKTNQFWFRIKTYREKTNIYSESSAEKEKIFIIDKEAKTEYYE